MASLSEDFEGGAHGAEVTTTNTALTGLDFTAAPVTTSDVVFTSEHQHTGSLSATAKPDTTPSLHHPFAHEPIVAEDFADSWWVRFETHPGTPEYQFFYRMMMGTPGADRTDDWHTVAVQVWWNDGWTLENIDGSLVPIGDLPEATWLKHTATFTAASPHVATYKIETADGDVLFEHTHNLHSFWVLGFAFHTWNVHNVGPLATWIDDISVGPLVTTTKAPACRKFPRDDSLGVGSGRHWPRPSTRQSSPRRGPAAPY